MSPQIEIRQDQKIPGAFEVLVDGEFIGLLTKNCPIVPGTYQLTEAVSQ